MTFKDDITQPKQQNQENLQCEPQQAQLPPELECSDTTVRSHSLKDIDSRALIYFEERPKCANSEGQT